MHACAPRICVTPICAGCITIPRAAHCRARGQHSPSDARSPEQRIRRIRHAFAPSNKLIPAPLTYHLPLYESPRRGKVRGPKYALYKFKPTSTHYYITLRTTIPYSGVANAAYVSRYQHFFRGISLKGHCKSKRCVLQCPPQPHHCLMFLWRP